MSTVQCKAVTSSGQQCMRKAGDSGYCHIHDPEKINQRQLEQQTREESRQRAWAKGDKMRQVLKRIEATCRAKGWTTKTSYTDMEEWRYAMIWVSRDGGMTVYDSGTLEIRVNGGVKATITDGRGPALKNLLDAIMEDLEQLPWLESRKKKPREGESISSHLLQVQNLIKRYYLAARQLTNRHDNRTTITINDEYDVQDFLHVLLKALFDDVREEEYTPSYAGASSRVDFLLKREKIVIETKMTSPKLRDKLLGEQLIETWTHFIFRLTKPHFYPSLDGAEVSF